MARRIIMRIELTPRAKQKMQAAVDTHGMTQISFTSRVLEWFCEQDQALQAAALKQLPERDQLWYLKEVARRLEKK